jgi:hypothetical protein
LLLPDRAWAVREYKEERGRFVVELDEGRMLMLKPANLRMRPRL